MRVTLTGLSLPRDTKFSQWRGGAVGSTRTRNEGYLYFASGTPRENYRRIGSFHGPARATGTIKKQVREAV